MRQSRVLSLLFLIGLFAPHLYPAETKVTIRPGDIIDWNMSGVPDDIIYDIGKLQFVVGRDGAVYIPHLGKMKVAGSTPSEIEKQIQDRYVAGKIFTHPILVISVQDPKEQVTVTVSGAVRAPGRQQWTPNLTLGSAVGSAGGVVWGNGPVRVIRGGKLLGKYDLREISRDPSKDIHLLVGDRVIVPE